MILPLKLLLLFLLSFSNSISLSFMSFYHSKYSTILTSFYVFVLPISAYTYMRLSPFLPISSLNQCNHITYRCRRKRFYPLANHWLDSREEIHKIFHKKWLQWIHIIQIFWIIDEITDILLLHCKMCQTCEQRLRKIRLFSP